jgi:uncharacterized damage-inducible protein DinB
MRDMEAPLRLRTAPALAALLQESAARMILAIQPLHDERWYAVPLPGVWSIGREAEHVAEAGAYHQWIVRLTIGEKVSSRRPVLERRQLTTDRSPADVAELIQRQTDTSARLILTLSDEHLQLPTRPARSHAESLAATIERVLIGHYDVHRAEIETKISR